MLTMHSLCGMPAKVVVGSDEQCFYVHTSLLCRHSKFFKAALKEEWAEGQERLVELLEEDPDMFNYYIQWLHDGTIFTWMGDPGDKSRYDHLTRLYALGETLMDTQFRDEVINAIVISTREKDKDGKQWFPGMAAAALIYQRTPPNSPARHLMVDLYVTEGSAAWIKNGAKDAGDSKALNNEFLSDVCIGLLQNRAEDIKSRNPYPALRSGVPCAYHNHDQDKPCEG